MSTDSKQRAAETTALIQDVNCLHIEWGEDTEVRVKALIEAALRAEREACAQIADGLWNGHIAAAIRGRE